MTSNINIISQNLQQFFEQPVSVILLPFLVSLLFLYKYVSPNNTHKKVLPSPPKLPIIGHLHLLGKHPHRSLHDLSKRYGELMLTHLGSKPTLIVSTANVAKEVMRTHDSVVSNRPKSIIFDKLLYNSNDVAAAPYGEYWRQMRSVCVLHLLSNKRVRSFRGIREEEAALLVEKIKKCGTSEVNLSEILVAYTNNVVCRAAFGRKYSENQQSGDFKELLQKFVELMGVFNVGDFIPWLSWVNRFNGLNKRLENVSKNFDKLLEEIIQEHRDKLNRKLNLRDGENHTKDFVDVLLELQKEETAGFPIGNDSIKALLVDTFVGGTDTTYTVLEWAMTELLRKPEAMKTLQEEVTEVTKGKDNISEDDLEKMKYLKAVIKETMRLHPSIPLLMPREAVTDLEINGYQIPDKTRVIVNAYAVQQDPRVWEDPEEFRPERFVESSVDFKGQDFQLVPFGGGRRICPGISFAIANIELVIAILMKNFKWTLPAGVSRGTLDMSESTGIAVHKKTPLIALASRCSYN